MKLPRLLCGGDLRERGRLQPSSLRLEQRLNRISHAEMTLPPGTAQPELGDLAEFYDGAGESAGVYRCCLAELDAATGTQRSVWEHALAFLGDEAHLGLSAQGEISCGEALEAVLSRQRTPRFTAGGADFGVRCEYDLDPGSLLEALLSIGDTLPGPWALTADFGARPWRLRFSRLSGEAECELRVRRNLSRLRLCEDACGLVTRVYPVGRNGLTLPEEYLEAESAAEWGVRARVLSDGSIRRTSHLRAWAASALQRLSQPALSVTAEGRDIFGLTGEPLDRLRLGACCRLPLPEEGKPLLRHISALVWEDLAASPERVRVTLAERREGISGAVGSRQLP